MKETRPDFWVVRVSMLGLDEKRLNQLLGLVGRSELQSGRRHAAATKVDAKRRYMAASQEKKYINVAAGSSKDEELDVFLRRLREAGYNAHKVPGPLLLATTGGKHAKVKIMPLSVSSTFAVTKELLTRAWKKANEDELDPDPDLDLESGREPKWSTHSLRRLADTVARRYAGETGATEAQIDIYFGWHEKILLKAMQNHYNAMSITARMALAKITGML